MFLYLEKRIIVENLVREGNFTFMKLSKLKINIAQFLMNISLFL